MHDEIQIATSDGWMLAASVSRQPCPNGGVIIINPAMGVSRQFYRHFARHLEDLGFIVVTYDYRGMGGSSRHGAAGAIRASHWGERDFAAVLQWVHDAYPGCLRIVVGHSIGGQIIGLAPNAVLVDKVVLVASQSGYWRHWKGWSRAAMFAWWHLAIPCLTRLAGRLPMRALGQGEDVPAGAALQWAQWGRLPGYLFDPRTGINTKRFESLYLHLLSISFSDDGYAPLRAVSALLSRYSSACITNDHVTSEVQAGRRIGHFGFFKPACADLWDGVARWILVGGGPPVNETLLQLRGLASPVAQ